MSIFTKFLASRVSGWIAVGAVAATLALGAVVVKIVADYKQLQVDAAFCKGRESAADILRSLQERAVDSVEREKSEVIDELEQIKEDATDEDGIPTGCAAERAPEPILRYHGLRD